MLTEFRRIHTKIENISTQQKSPAEEYNNLPKNFPIFKGFEQTIDIYEEKDH